MQIGVIGNGFVGKATCQLQCREINVLSYDLNPALCVPPGTTLEDLVEKCEIIFVSVPTPMSKTGECHLAILESVVQQLHELNYARFIVVRSTVPVGTCDRLGVYFMPEFLTEKNYIQDFIDNKDWIFGEPPQKNPSFQTTIERLMNAAHANRCIQHNTLHFTSNSTAEMTKLFRNCYLATKVAFCNEIFQFCEEKGITYEDVRFLATLDDRITTSHSKTPGHDGRRGFGGTCFPKDMASLRHQIQTNGLQSFIIRAAIERNETIDRPEKDWSTDVGRATI